MENRGKTDKQNTSAPEGGQKSVKTNSTFTQDVRFVVTRNIRNAWMDDLYETAPAAGNSLPVFH